MTAVRQANRARVHQRAVTFALARHRHLAHVLGRQGLGVVLTQHRWGSWGSPRLHLGISAHRDGDLVRARAVVVSAIVQLVLASFILSRLSAIDAFGGGDDFSDFMDSS